MGGDIDMDLVTLIQQLGVPVSFALIFAIATAELFKADREDRKEEERQHKEEIDKLREAFTNNTLVLTKLVDKIEQILSKEEE